MEQLSPCVPPVRKATATAGSRMKIALNMIGTIALALAVLGIFLPLLPTTPFLLLASACYVRGSERMHRRLLGAPLFGEYLRNIEEKRGIPLRAKIIAIALLWTSILLSVHTVKSMPLQIMLIMVATGVSIYLARMKTLRANRPGNDNS